MLTLASVSLLVLTNNLLLLAVAGESMRVLRISNSTEFDIWQYIAQENIRDRAAVTGRRTPGGAARWHADPGRRRAHSAAAQRGAADAARPLSHARLLNAAGAVVSDATTLPAVIAEVPGARSSEREGRVIDRDGAASMEQKKQNGSF